MILCYISNPTAEARAFRFEAWETHMPTCLMLKFSFLLLKECGL